MSGVITRKRFLKTASAGLAGILASSCSPAIVSHKTTPNVIFITADALRADHLGCYGYHRNTSPNIDMFAERNILFKNFFTVSPRTGPSMTSFFTGKYLQNHGVVRNRSKWDDSLEGIFRILPKHYRKAAFVCNPVVSGLVGFRMFEQCVHSFFEQENVTKIAKKWLKYGAGDSRFFLWVHYRDPHGPYRPPPKFDKMFIGDPYYDASKKIPPAYLYKDKEEDNIPGGVPGYTSEENIDSLDYYVAQYDAEIKYMDAEVGRLLKYIYERNLAKDSIIIFSSDHGESMGECNYYFEHGMLVTEGTIHIPFIMSHPDVREPLMIDSLLQNTDFGPTILKELGLEFSSDVDGIDFSDLYLERKPDFRKRDFIYSCTPHERVFEHFYETIRTDKIKLIRKDELTDYQLYDIEQDRAETNDIFPTAHADALEPYIELMKMFGKQTAIVASDGKPPEDLAESLKALGYVN